MRQFVEEIEVGKRTVAGTEFPVVDQLHRTGEREWTVTRELCNGTPRSAETYRSERAAREAFDRRLTGRKPRADRAATERIELRVTPAERRAWEQQAERAGVTMSEWIRSRLNA